MTNPRNGKSFDLINIHGSLNDRDNPPIFGFGDGHNDKYKEIMKADDNEPLRHIKGFDYSKTTNYHQLVRFIESGKYQVQIFGHSCGLSDRTMLQKIFIHDNCWSIKVFYYKLTEEKNDFIEKLYNIYKHFTDDEKPRELIVPFDLSSPIPQPKNI